MREFSEYERILWLHNRFKNNSFSKEEYFHTFGRHSRTFSRDVQKLKNYLGAPLVCKNRKYVYTDKTFELPALLLNEKELFGLLVATAVIEMYKDTPLYTSLTKIFDRLSGLLCSDVKYLYIDVNKGNSKLREFNWEFLQQIIKAVYEHHQLEIQYHSFNRNKITKRIVEPYHVYNYRGEFYMVAYCQERKCFRDFFIGRIKELRDTNIAFKPRRFLLDEYFSDKQWGIIKGGKVEKVIFKVRKEKEPWIVERYGERLKKLKEEKNWTTYQIETEVTDEFVNWILGYKDEFVVLKPTKVKKEILEYCQEIIENYR